MFIPVALSLTFGFVCFITALIRCRLRKLCDAVINREDWSFETSLTQASHYRVVYWFNGNQYIVYPSRGRSAAATIEMIRKRCIKTPNIPWTDHVESVHVNEESYPGVLRMAYPNGEFKATRNHIKHECGFFMRRIKVVVKYFDGEIRLL